MSHQSRSANLKAECIFFLVTTILTTVLRVIARRQSKAGLWWDDHLSFVAAIFVIAIIVLGYIEARHGLGQHLEVVGLEGVSFYLKALFADGLIYNCSLCFVKLSVLCFYSRIFAIRTVMRQILWITAMTTIAWCISVVVVCLFECVPVRAAWDKTIVNARCIDFLQFYYGSAGSSIVLDFVLLVIPMPFIWRLQMDRPHKFALTTTFLLGYLNPVISFVRLAYLIRLGPKVNEPDITWNFVDLTMWSIAECTVALVSAHIPSLQFLFSRLTYNIKHRSVHTIKSGARLEDETTLVESNTPSTSAAHFQRLCDDNSTPGLKGVPRQYGAFAYTQGTDSGDNDLELQPMNTTASRIHVSKRIDVFSSKSNPAAER